MTIETEIAALTTATTSLLGAVNVAKSTLDTKVSDASASALTAQSAKVAAEATINVLSFTAPENVTVDHVVIAGDLIGIAANTATTGQALSVKRQGVFDMPKVAGEVFAVGGPVYWNKTTKVYTNVSAGNVLIGAATVAAIAGAARVSFVLQLNGARTVTAQTNAVTGGIAKLNVGLNSFSLNRVVSSIASIAWASAVGNLSTFSGYTWSITKVIPADVIGIRLAFVGTTSGASIIDNVAICSSSVYDTTQNPVAGSAWVQGTFNKGSSSQLSMPQVVDRPLNTHKIYWSDVIPITTVARTDATDGSRVILIRCFSSSANIAAVGHGQDNALSANMPLGFRTGFKVGNFVSANQSGFTGFTNPSCSIVYAAELVHRSKNAVTLADFGDSIQTGFKSSINGHGVSTRAAAILTAQLGVQVMPFQACESGQRSIVNLQKLESLIESGRGLPTFAVFRPYSVNSLLNGQSADEMLSYADRFCDACFRAGIIPILQTGILETAETWRNATMLTVNAGVRIAASRLGVYLFDAEPLISVGNAASLLDADGVHPNEAFTQQMGVAMAEVVKSAMITL